jgi:hypothetical protein
MEIQHLQVTGSILRINTNESGSETFNLTPTQKELLLPYNPVDGSETPGWEFTYEYFISVVNN